MKHFKEKVKSYLPLATVAFLLFLLVHYWDALIGWTRLLWSAAFSLILGGIIAYLVNIVMSFYEKVFVKLLKKEDSRLKRPVCMLLAFISIILVVTLVIVIVVPEFAKSIILIVDSVQKSLTDIVNTLGQNELVGSYVTEAASKLPSLDNVSGIVQKVGGFLVNGATGAYTAVVGSASKAAGVVANFVFAIIFAIYILAGKEQLAVQTKGLIRTYLPNGNKIIRLIALLHENFHDFFVAQVTDATIFGCLCALGMFILRFPYAGMSGIIIGFTALIPVVGAFLGAALCAFIILMASPIHAALFLVFIVILQQIDNNIIYPRVVGSSVELPGIWVLAAVTVGGGLFGMVGMMCGVPVTATLYKLLKEDYHKRRAKQLLKEAAEKEKK